MKTIYQNNNILSQLGSFWYNNTTQETQDQAKYFADLALRLNLKTDFENVVKNLTNADVDYYKTNFFLYYNDTDVVHTDSTPGTNNPQPWDPSSIIITKYYTIPKKEADIEPLSLLAKKKPLYLGIDFFISEDYIWFLENPIDLFPDNKIYVMLSYNKEDSLFSYPMNVTGEVLEDSTKALTYITKYYKNAQSPKYLKLALASLGKLPIIQKGGQIQEVVTLGDTTRYIFEDETINVSFAHTEFDPFTFQPAETVVGQALEIVNSKTHGNNWWSLIDWGSEFDLYPYTGLDVKLPNSSQIINSAGGDNIEISLLGTEQNLFWQRIHEKENANNEYIINHISENVGDSINPIELFFRLLFNKKGVLIYIDSDIVQNVDVVESFLKQNLPFGWVPIIRIQNTSIFL